MPYITREDGERFIIPSYRDMLSAKKAALLKREILLLSSNYGEYITLQRKNVEQYEVAFSNEPGYLLGECIWANFNRPFDMIYCEAIANSSDAILVIVKNGNVYLDGSFPIDSIPEELVIFKTQKNSFDIYIYGDVPIAQNPEEGKFSFDSSSIRSFTALETPTFPTLKGIKAFQLQLIDTVLKEQGIGVFPARKIIGIIAAIIVLFFLYHFLTSGNNEVIPTVFVNAVNPYQGYYQALTSPAPDNIIYELADKITQLYTVPGWITTEVQYQDGMINAKLKSLGGNLSVLHSWVLKNNWSLSVLSDGVSIKTSSKQPFRQPPRTINAMGEVVATLIDRIAYIMPGNHLKIGALENNSAYASGGLTIDFTNISPGTLLVIADQLKNLPLVIDKITITFNNGFISGSINMKVYGYTTAEQS